jgi:glycosyltransferase involved in cell wall biosynthesis
VRVALDAQLALGTATGIGEYVRGLLPSLRDAGVDVTALTAPWLDPWRFDRRVLWDQLVLPHVAAGRGLLHCAAGTVPAIYQEPFVVTVHDVAWLRTQQHTRPYARWYFGRFMLGQYRRAAQIVVDSEFSRGELIELTGIDGSGVHVVHPGVSAEFARLERRAPNPDLPATILAVGTVERRKNLEVVIRALPALRQGLRRGVKLLVVGPATPYQDECSAIARELRVEDLIDVRGYLTRDELLAIYARAAVAVVPSRYEGFGYAAAQALCAGVPLVVARTSSLPEVVAGTPATLISADDPSEWSETISGIIENRTAAGEQAAAARGPAIERFSWDRAAQQTRRVYELARE